MIVAAEQLAGIGELRAAAIAMRARGLGVELAVLPAGQEVADQATARGRAGPSRKAQQAGKVVVLARRVVGRIAVDHPLLEVAVVAQRLQRKRVAELDVGRQVCRRIAVGDQVGCRELHIRRGGQELDGRGARSVQVRICRRHVEVQLGFLAAPADVSEHVLDVGRLQIAPTVLVQGAAGDVGRDVFAARRELELALDMAERSAGAGRFEALEAESVLQPDIDGSAESIEAEDGLEPSRFTLSIATSGMRSQ